MDATTITALCCLHTQSIESTMICECCRMSREQRRRINKTKRETSASACDVWWCNVVQLYRMKQSLCSHIVWLWHFLNNLLIHGGSKGEENSKLQHVQCASPFTLKIGNGNYSANPTHARPPTWEYEKEAAPEEETPRTASSQFRRRQLIERWNPTLNAPSQETDGFSDPVSSK